MQTQKNQPVITIENNLDRTKVAGEAIELFAARTGISDEDCEMRVSDLLANMMHYCNQYGVDFQEALFRATCNYDVECPIETQ